MAEIKWKLKGKWLKNCNCDYGCPCDFNSKPTHGICEGMVGMDIEEGHFGGTDLSGLRWAGMYHWPGPLHEGNGTLLPIVDERADAKQREALLTIMSGQEQSEGAVFFIFASLVSKVLEPKFAPIEFEFDLKKRTAHCRIPGILETASEPIKNPVTGEPHRILINMPEGFEYEEAEVAAASYIKGLADLQFEWSNAHSSMAHVEHTSEGLVHQNAAR